MHRAGLLFTVVLGNRTSKSLFSGFVDVEDVETQSIRYSFCLSSIPAHKINYSDWVCTAVMSNDVMKDLRG